MDTLQKIREIVAQVTENPIDSINHASGSKNVNGWDSVAQINIIVMVEMEFGISFTADELHQLNSVERISAALKLQVPA